MSLPRYPKYKNSGVEWLGDVPEHWVLPKLKSIASFSGGGTPSRENLEYWNGNIPWVSPKDMKAERIVGAEESITEEGLRNSSASLQPSGRVLMVVRSGILKHTIPVAITETSVALNQDMKALHFDDNKCVNRFFLRWVQGLNNQLLLAWAKQGATVESIEHTYLANTVIPMPNATEQTQIAEFLDRETAKIDELVGEQRRLMELLKEKRQAVISHAVTQGLNPHAPMKPSGIEWLGDVPEHWKVVPFRNAASYQEGPGIMASDFLDSGVPLLRVSGVQGRWASLEGCNYLSPEKVAEKWDHFRLHIGDLLISASASMGTVCEVNELTTGAIPYTGLIRLSPKSGAAIREFIRAFVVSKVFSTQIDLLKAGATIQHFGPTHLQQVKMALPPIAEQEALCQFINDSNSEFDALVTEAQRAIDLLQERRTALISAAVTGQIDVRTSPQKKAA